jgi:adenylyltransferase/sulfurtransferase
VVKRKQDNKMQQYQRQIILPGIGESGQQKLLEKSVLVIGAGGLGCPALQYLVAAGVGTIGIVDGDTIDLSNLHRQILYGMDDIGKLKAITASVKLQQINPSCNIKTFECYLDKSNAFEIIGGFDIILDGSDNFSTRYLVNDACVLLKKPLVYGAIYRFEGQVAVFNVLLEDESYSCQYRDLFPQPPANIQNCAEAGVLGVLPGIIGCMQATEVIKLVTGIGRPLINSLLSYNALTNDSYVIALDRTEEGSNALPANKAAFMEMNYDIDCSFNNAIQEITIDEFDELRNKEEWILVDVRELNESPLINEFEHIKLPMSNFKAEDIDAVKIILFCQSGSRSKVAAEKILNKYPYKKVYSLKGGINSWLNP